VHEHEQPQSFSVAHISKVYAKRQCSCALLELRYEVCLPLLMIALLHTTLTNYHNRGIFYFYCGTITLAEWNVIDIIVGLYMMGLGVGMFYYGAEAEKKLSAMHVSGSVNTLKTAYIRSSSSIDKVMQDV
jgi:hypothetical protein